MENQGPTTGLTPHLAIPDKRGAEAIDFYGKAFGATEQARMLADDGVRLMHAHLIVNGASLMMHDDFPEYTGGAMAPPSGVTLHLQVDDTDAWYDRAIAAGATPRMPPEDMFWGDRYAQVTDPFGHAWSIGTPVKGEK
jgi:PhnB protein